MDAAQVARSPQKHFGDTWPGEVDALWAEDLITGAFVMTKGRCWGFAECDSNQTQSQQVGVLLAKGALGPLILFA